MISIGRSSIQGRGVFAQNRISEGTLIEEAPVVVIPSTQIANLDRTALCDYYFLWGEDETEAALLLGTCSLCNHSYDPNAIFVLNPQKLSIAFVARREIMPGEEVTINYHGDPESREPLWFPLEP
jgi:SET domain-containing protein